ncbi:hypothetical protein LB506_005757 [Fusarium annulatum]|nr:hypothetical protein LB506_005757 [Fusarium annulatum]
MVRFIRAAFLFISILGLTQGFMNDPPNRPPRAGKRTHRGCYRSLSDTADPVVKAKGDKTKNTWTACGQYCLAKRKPMALVQGEDCYCSETIPNRRKIVGGFDHYCMDPCPGKPTDLVACGSERFGSYSAINTGLKSELKLDQDALPHDPIPGCLGCIFKLPSDVLFPGEASGVKSCRDACRYLESKTFMMYDKQCVCTNDTLSVHTLDRVSEEMCSFRWARKPCGGYSYSLRSELFNVYDVSEPEKSAPDVTKSQSAATPTVTQTAKTPAQTSWRSVGEIIEDKRRQISSVF